MPNPNTEGTAPVAPPPLATYPLRNGMAQLLTAARASHPPLPRGPPALLALLCWAALWALAAGMPPQRGCDGVLVPARIAEFTGTPLTNQAQRRPPLRVDARRVSSVGGGASAGARLLGAAPRRGRRAAGRGACPWRVAGRGAPHAGGRLRADRQLERVEWRHQLRRSVGGGRACL